ncbi:hypothetical protein ABZ135_23735 [Streptomyces sp. NPDC006339]|uniref:hypothetical protein n=1 Tax=Streptomyces sp. NPDC006339 TaxID=3156755 RepID=UPI0033ACCF7C
MHSAFPDRLHEIRARLTALPDAAWRQRFGDAGLIEDITGQPVAVLGTSGDTTLPAGEFIAHARADIAWLVAEVTRLRCRDTMRPDPLERLGAVLILRLGSAWVPATRPGERAVTLLHTVTNRRIVADPYQGRIILQARTDNTDAFTPTGSYTPDLTGHEDLEDWLSTGDLTAASTVLADVAHQLLAQMPAEPGDIAAEEVLATQASELAEKATAFAAHLILRQPARAAARDIYRLAAQIVETADVVDDHLGY